MKTPVPFVDFPATFRLLESELMESCRRVLSSGQFILRNEVEEFERTLTRYLRIPHAVGVNSGSDALALALATLQLRPTDEVITVSHTFVATIAAIVRAGARPVLVDIDQDFAMDPSAFQRAITPRTRAVIVVHMNGRACRLREILDICEARNIVMIEDAAMAIGAGYDQQPVGTFGHAGCFSTHPMKTLGGAGDGGFVTTSNPAVDAQLRLLRNNGQKTKEDLVLFGQNSRLDELQAAILNVKMKHLDSFIRRRREIANLYQKALASTTPLLLPPAPQSESRHFDTYSQYVIRARDLAERERLLEFLHTRGIEAHVQRKRPVHLHPELGLSHFELPQTVDLCNRMISLPIFETMSDAQVGTVTTSLRDFYA